MSEEDKVRILLAEYSSLRAEIIARLGHGYQLLTIGTAVLGIMFVFPTRGWFFYIAATVIGVVYLIACGFVVIDLNKIGRRVREIEHEINIRAGEHLLVWEHLWGGLATGYLKYGRELPRSSLPPLTPPSKL